MRLYVGTSGYSYKEWKGPFYPADLPASRMLGWYAERLPTVEVNNTFYRMPRPEVVARWADAVPEGFVFVVKASQRITHRARLKDARESVDYLWDAVSGLGSHLGPILFQLPPNFRCGVERLEAFLAELPAGCRSVFEFRHASWDTSEVRRLLGDAGAALCLADQDDGPAVEAELFPTADWGYLRLRRPSYDDEELRGWAERIRRQPWREVFVFFKHEDAGLAPQLALRFASLFEAAGAPSPP